VRQEPWKLPAPFEWKNCDLTDDDMLNQVYELLTRNYVEDDDNMFRFDYSPAFLKWAMCPPGWKEDWLLGVVDSRNGKLFAFISAVPVHIRARDKTVPMAEVNFLCVHKKLRSRRLAPGEWGWPGRHWDTERGTAAPTRIAAASWGHDAYSRPR